MFRNKVLLYPATAAGSEKQLRQPRATRKCSRCLHKNCSTLLLAALTFFVGIGLGFFAAVNRLEGSFRGHGLHETSHLPPQRQDDYVRPRPVKPQQSMLAATTSAMIPCLWTEIEDLAEENGAVEFSKRVVVTSSHGTSEGTSFLVIGNSNLDKLRCGIQTPMRNIALSDPTQTNRFNLHRIDCPPNTDLAVEGSASLSCPSLPQGQHSKSSMTLPPPAEARNVLCMAPLYGVRNGRNGRFLMEFIMYHLSLGFDHIVVPNVELTENEDLFLFLESLQQQQQIRIIQWDDEHTNHWLSGGKLYEHGKLPAWNRCYLEYQETADWMLFIDVDELLSIKTTGQSYTLLNKNKLQPLLEWMERQYARSQKRAFSVKSRAVLSVLDHEIDPDKMLLEQWNALETQPKCPYSCGIFHQGRWKYFVKGHGSRSPTNEARKTLAPLPYLLWTHSVHGLDYQFIKSKVMDTIDDRDLAELRHYQAHWYIHGIKARNYTALEFQTTFAPLPMGVLNDAKKALSPYSSIYKKSSQGLSWALKNNENNPLPVQFLDAIRTGQKSFTETVSPFPTGISVHGSSKVFPEDSPLMPTWLTDYIEFHRRSLEMDEHGNYHVKEGIPSLKLVKKSGGVGDRMNALIGQFYLAICHRRVFIAHPPRKLDLFLQPRLIKWNAQRPSNPNTVFIDKFEQQLANPTLLATNATDVDIFGRNLLAVSGSAEEESLSTKSYSSRKSPKGIWKCWRQNAVLFPVSHTL